MPDFNDIAGGAAKKAQISVNALRLYRETQRLINGEEECSDKEVQDAAKQAETKANENYKQVITETIAKKGMAEVTRLFKSVVAGTLSAGSTVVSKYVDSFITQVILGKVVGTLFSALAVIISALPAGEIFYQYLIVKQLQLNATRRSQTSYYILNKLNILINLLNNFFKINITGGYDKYAAIAQAIKYTQNAKSKVDREAARAINGLSIRVIQIKDAERLLDLAAETLIIFPNNFGANLYKLSEVHKKFALTTQLPKVNKTTNNEIGIKKKDWQDYFKNVQNEISSKYDVTSNDPAKALKQATQQELINNLMPLVPGEIRILFIQHAFAEASQGLLRAFPVKTAISLGTGLSEKVSEISDNILKKVFNKPVSPINEYPYNFNFKGTTTNIKYNEALILIFPSMWKQVKTISSLYYTFLVTTGEELDKIIVEMQQVVNLKISTDEELVIKRNGWSTKLQLIKTDLYPVTDENNGIPGLNGTNINPNDLQNFIESTGTALEPLKTFIADKIYDASGNRKPDSALIAYNYAQTALLPLLLDVLILASESSSKKLLSDLQIIKRTISDTIQSDSMEIKLCNDYISSIESHPIFPKVKSAFETSNKYIMDSPYSDIAKSLENGDLGAILTIAESVSDAKDLANAVDKCTDQEDTSALTADTSILTVADYMTNKKYSSPSEYEYATNFQKKAIANEKTLKTALLSAKNTVLIAQDYVNKINDRIVSKNETIGDQVVLTRENVENNVLS